MAVVISNNLVLLDRFTGEPLNHARIGYAKIAGTITASSSAPGYPASDADYEMTYNYWKPQTMPANWEVNPGGNTACTYMAIAAHTFGTDGTTVSAQFWNGTQWVTLASSSPLAGDDSPIMFIFSELAATKYRIYISGSTSPRVGVIYIGKTLDMQRAIYGGNSPITLSRETVTRPTISERGQWLGRSIIRAGSTGSWSWQNLKAAWYRANFDPFVEHARTKPFFIAWRPETFPDEIAYCWTDSDISPTNQGVADFMSVTLNAKGLGIE